MDDSMKDQQLCQRLIGIRQYALVIAFSFVALEFFVAWIVHPNGLVFYLIRIAIPSLLLVITANTMTSLYKQITGDNITVTDFINSSFANISEEQDRKVLLAVNNASKKKNAIRFLMTQAVAYVAIYYFACLPLTLFLVSLGLVK
jgi:hypothetical protein